MKFVSTSKIAVASLTVFCLELAPMLAAAQGAPVVLPDRAGSPPQGLSFRLENPLAFGTLQEFIVAILRVIIVIAVPIVVIFIVLAGFKYVTARGEVGKIQEATRSLTYAIIGGVLIIGAVAIAEIIENLVTAFSA